MAANFTPINLIGLGFIMGFFFGGLTYMLLFETRR